MRNCKPENLQGSKLVHVLPRNFEITRNIFTCPSHRHATVPAILDTHNLLTKRWATLIRIGSHALHSDGEPNLNLSGPNLSRYGVHRHKSGRTEPVDDLEWS